MDVAGDIALYTLITILILFLNDPILLDRLFYSLQLLWATAINFLFLSIDMLLAFPGETCSTSFFIHDTVD